MCVASFKHDYLADYLIVMYCLLLVACLIATTIATPRDAVYEADVSYETTACVMRNMAMCRDVVMPVNR